MTAIRIILIAMLCGSAHAGNVIPKYRNLGNRIDSQVSIDESLYTSMVMWVSANFDDGTNYYDLSDKGNDMIATAAASTPEYSLEAGGSLLFDGTNDTIIYQLDRPDLTPTDNGFSMCCWIKPKKLSASSIDSLFVKRGTGGDEYQFVLYQKNLRPAVFGNNDSTEYVITPGNTDLNVDQWYHVGWTFDGGSNVVAYLDGYDDSAASIRNGDFSGVVNSTNPLRGGIWYDLSQFPFQGWIDDLRVFDRLLSSNEMHDIYLLGSTNGSGTH